MPRYSIITVTRDNLPGLRRTAACLAGQVCRDFEWIVIDGASSDGTPAFLATTDAQWISEPDQGIYDAMNKGIARATGDYILFLNAGDILAAPGILADVAVLAGDLLYGDGREGGRVKHAHAHTHILWGMFTYHQAIFYRRATVGALRYDTAYKIAADYKFTAQFLRGGASATYWPHVVCDFEPGGISQTAAARGRRELAAIRAELNLCPPAINHLITAAHAILWVLRRRYPAFYDYMRSIKKP